MKKTRFTEDQFIRVLQEASGGRAIKEVCRHHGITETTFCRWRNKYGGHAGLVMRSIHRSWRRRA